MKTKAMIGLYAAIVFSGTPASAEKLKKSTAPKLEEITIYARKKSEEINTTPITVTAFDRADLRKFQLSRINELEKLTPNLQFDTTSPISGSTQSAAVFIRGIGQSEFLLTNDSGVGIYVDGAYRARSLGAVLDTASIAQIEIIKGPQGMLFGKNTIGGAINILTEPPRDALSATITTRFGSDHRLDAVATADIPITPDLVTHWAFSSRQIDGYSERLLTGDKQGNEDMQSFFSKWLWRATDALNITLAIDGQDSQESSSPPVSPTNHPISSKTIRKASKCCLAAIKHTKLPGKSQTRHDATDHLLHRKHEVCHFENCNASECDSAVLHGS